MIFGRRWLWTGWFGVAASLFACGEDSQTSSSSAGAGADTSTTSSDAGGDTSSGGGGAQGGTGGGGAQGGSTGGTGPTEAVRIIVIGDTGEGNADQHCVADAMSAKCLLDDCDAVLLAGDNFYKDSDGVIASNGGVVGVDDPYWVTHFEEPYDRMGLNGLPFYPVLGNHDYSPAALQAIVGSSGVKQAQIDYSSLPVGTGPGPRLSDKWTMPAAWYDVDVASKGVLHIFGIDTVNAAEFSRGTTQLVDMQNRVSTSTIPWKLVFGHHPRWTSGDHALDNDLLNFATTLLPPSMYDLQQGIYCQADVYLAGHDHNREYIAAGQDPSCPDTHFLISGAGAKVRDSAAPMLANSQYYDQDIEGFFYLTFTASQVVIDSYDMDPANCTAPASAVPAYTTTIAK